MAEGSPRLDWAAFYLDGRTPERRAATVRLGRSGLEATIDGGATVRWPYGEIRQTQGFHAGEPVRLERGGDLPEIIVVPDPAFIASLKATAADATPRFGRTGRRWVFAVLCAGLGAVVVGAALYVRAIPAISEIVAARVPPSWEDRVGAAVIERLAPAQRRCGGVEGQQALEHLLARLTDAAPSPYRFRIAVLDERAVNAFAAPGGHLIVLRGLIERARAPEEIAGVLAHEVQHVLRRHATRALVQRTSTALLVAAAIGDVSGLIAFAAETATTLSYSRSAEEEADADGMRLLHAAGIDPRGMIAFFETVSADEWRLPKAARYLTTHPASDDRVARLTRMLPSGGPSPTPALSVEQWHALRAVCDRRS